MPSSTSSGLERRDTRSVHPALRAFRSKSFRIFYAGQGLSLLGNWMQTVAMSWLVYRVTGSALLLGVTAGAQQLPILFLSPIAGVWADRVNRQLLLMLIQSLAFVQALTLTLLTFAGTVRVPHLIALALFLGIITGLRDADAAGVPSGADRAQGRPAQRDRPPIVAVPVDALRRAFRRGAGPRCLRRGVVLSRQRSLLPGDHRDLRRRPRETARASRYPDRVVAPARIGNQVCLRFHRQSASFAAPHGDGFFHRALVLADADFRGRDLQRRLEDFRLSHRCGRAWRHLGHIRSRGAQFGARPRPGGRRRHSDGRRRLGRILLVRNSLVVAHVPRGLWCRARRHRGLRQYHPADRRR